MKTNIKLRNTRPAIGTTPFSRPFAWVTFSICGYAIPGVILAVAFITFISWFDNYIFKIFFDGTMKTIFIGSITGLVI